VCVRVCVRVHVCVSVRAYIRVCLFECSTGCQLSLGLTCLALCYFTSIFIVSLPAIILFLRCVLLLTLSWK